MDASKRVRLSDESVPKAESDVIVYFTKLEAELRAYDEKREVVIKKSRDVQKAAKQAIYALHRQDLSGATVLLTKCADLLQKELLPLIESDVSLRQGSLSACIEEYAEAEIFKSFLASSEAMPTTQLAFAESEEYLGGLFDACGEIQRYAVIQATKRDLAQVERARNFIDFVHGRTQMFDFRNGALRKKSDGVKWTLKRVEEILFDLSLGNTRTSTSSGGPQAPAEADDGER